MPTLQEYADRAKNEVLERLPAKLTVDWGVTRINVIASIGRGGIFETLSLQIPIGNKRVGSEEFLCNF